MDLIDRIVISAIAARFLDGGRRLDAFLPKISTMNPFKAGLGGSWDLVSTVISTLSGVISNYKYSYLNYNPSY